jgi:predicted MFS family arabinose efflux permease
VPSNARPVDRKLIALLAIGCGATVANLYYAQPLLEAIGSHFGVSDGTAGLLVTVSQIAYGLGLVFLAPLSDLVDRRKLVAALLTISCLASAGAAAAPQFGVLALAIGVASATSVVAQVLVPFASTLAPEGERGQVVGMVMSGLLTGVLLARTLAGLVAGAAGWRTVYVFAAVAMAVLALALWRVMPKSRPSTDLRYRALLASIGALIRREPLLRRRMVFGACGYAGFSLVWTTLTFLLSDPPFNFGESTIGLFGLAGLGGAVAAMRMGRLHDRGHGRVATGAVSPRSCSAGRSSTSAGPASRRSCSAWCCSTSASRRRTCSARGRSTRSAGRPRAASPPPTSPPTLSAGRSARPPGRSPGALAAGCRSARSASPSPSPPCSPG